MAMNLSFFFTLLFFFLTPGWCRALGTCPEPEVCFSANRESCKSGSTQCGECFPGYIQNGEGCISEDASPNDESWESVLESTDDSDLADLFDTTTSKSPTENPTNDQKQESSPVSSHSSSDLTSSVPSTGEEDDSNELNDENNDLEGKVAAQNAESSPHRPRDESIKSKSLSDLNSKAKDLKNRGNNIERNDGVLLKKRTKSEDKEEVEHKKHDEEKLNKFLTKLQKKDEDEVSGKDLSSQHAINLDVNSSTNPPPFIRKHKVGKTDEAKASEMDDIYFLFIVIGCSVAGIAGLGLAGYCWYKLHTTAKAVSEAEYSSYGTKGSSKQPHSVHGDDKLDYNAEMYHYHQTKSQLAAMEKAGGSRTSKQGSLEEDENSDEGDEGDYTVYECPGLAPTGDMTVVNPLFSDQEAVGSDQDANGNRSGHSSPPSSRHSSTTKPSE